MTLTTRLAVAMIALVAIAVSAVGWLSYRSVEQMIPPRVLDHTETRSSPRLKRPNVSLKLRYSISVCARNHILTRLCRSIRSFCLNSVWNRKKIATKKMPLAMAKLP